MNIVKLGVGAGIPSHSGGKYGGTEKGVYWVSHWLGRLGCQVHVIDIKGKEEHERERQKSAAEFHEIQPLPFNYVYKFPFLSRFFNYFLALAHLFFFAKYHYQKEFDSGI